MKLYVCVWIGILLCIPFLSGAKDINVFNTDTAWIVNYQYSQVERDTFDFKLNIPELPDDYKEYKFIRVLWGMEKNGVTDYTDISDITELPKELSHKYPTGKYFLAIRYFKNAPSTLADAGDKETCLWIFNQDLQGHITKDPRDLDGCLESGVDTFRVKMVNHLENPPGTKYRIEVRSDASGDDFWKISPDPQFMKDSGMVVFSEATGTFGADIRFRMTYREDEHAIESRTAVTEWISVYVYQTPDLNAIFNFRDTLVEGEDINTFKRIEVCTNEEMSQIVYDSLVNVRYTYVDNLPMYRSRYNFEVDYYRKDSINQPEWKNVTADTAMVDTMDMIFKYPGFYKIRMVAFNQCGLDSLHTDSIRNREEKRHIVVYQGGTNTIRCDEDTLCGMSPEGRWISFMDTGKRFEWDPVPEYEFLITRPKNGVPDKDTVLLRKAPELVYYKNDVEFIPDKQEFACDSTLMKFKLYEPGRYNIRVTRSRYCDPPVVYTHAVVIGDVPDLPVDTLWKHFGQEKGNPIYKCDTFFFSLPEIRIDSNYMGIDSIQWCFEKGRTRLDTLYQEYGVEQIYKFDSIGDTKNKMTLRAHNFCGWSGPEEAELYTSVMPNVKLWRDSLPINDSLCVGINYKYHWIGDLPQQYRIIAEWDKNVDVNGRSVNQGQNVTLASSYDPGIPEVGTVRFKEESNRIYGHFTIKNQANLSCVQELKDTVVVLGVPDGVIYDTIRYCPNLSLLKTEALFETTSPEFKWVEWKWNDKPATVYKQSEYKQEFNFDPSGLDSLYVRTSNSKGCYVENRLVMERQVLPQLEFHDKQKSLCADAVVASAEFTHGYIRTTNAGTIPEVQMKVYQDEVGTASLLFDTTGSAKIERNLEVNHETEDTVRLIYELNNERITSGFGDCLYRDTVTLKVWKPVVRITGTDTLRDLNATTYSFTGPGVGIDTADIKDQLITWRILNGVGSLDDVHKLKPVYSLGGGDKALDSLAFELSGDTPCGLSLKDTLLVYLPKEELWAHTDTICHDDDGYGLWAPEKTFGKFVNPATLKWKLLPDKNGLDLGSLTSSGLGKEVKYVPSLAAWQADTVKIEVLAYNLYDATSTGLPLRDTVCLKVNHAPENIYPDTLYLKADTPEGRKVMFDDITVGRNGIVIDKTKAYCQTMEWTMVKSEGEGAAYLPSAANIQGVSIGTPPGQDNYAADLKITMKGYKGCRDQFETLVLVGVLPPKVSMESFDLCDKGSVSVDGGYEVQATDKFTTLEWSHNGNGSFSPDFKLYQAGENDPINQFVLKATKNFTLYNNTSADYSHSASGIVRLYKRPDFKLYDGANRDYSHDTLCLNDSGFKYERDWVDGNYDGNFTIDRLIANKSEGLTGNFPDFTLNEGVDQAKLIVTTDFGTCKKWVDVGDTIYITRLKEMTGDFDVPAGLCEGSSVMITNVSVDPMAKSYSWTAEGGTIDQTDLQHPVFTSTSGSASVRLHITPPHGCTPVTEITKPITIKEKPFLILRDTTICEGTGLSISFFRHPQVKSIVWKVNNRQFATTTSESTVNYNYTPSDVVDGKVRIVAEITPDAPCQDVVLSNEMAVSYQQKPLISGSLQGMVCQGDSLTLTSDIVSVQNHGSLLWSLVGGSMGRITDPDQVDTKYVPGEISGVQRLQIVARGLNKCPDVTKNIDITVNKSELPVISVPNIKCEDTEITFTHNVSDKPAGAAGKWYVNDVEESDRWYSFTKTFETAGNYQLRLTTTYNGICPRSAEQDIKVNPLPKVDFTAQPDSIVGAGKEVVFTNTTANTITYDWDFHGQGVAINDENGVHVHRFDLADVPYLFTDVTLTVRDGLGCEASKTRQMKVVNVPKAAFEILAFDHCTGDIEFKDLSVGEDISYSWDMGNGVTLTDTIPAGFAYTPILKDSTYTISLKVSNESGEHTYVETVDMISLLKPKFIISPDKEGCENRQAAKGFSNRTEGDADLYTYTWGDGSPDGVYSEFYPFPIYHKYNNPEPGLKKFYVTLTAANACHTVPYQDSISIYPNAISTEFIPDATRICFGNEITFKNESFGFGTDVQAWWTFDPNQGPIENNDYEVVHRFNKPGVFPVKLVMTDRCNSDTSAVVDIVILGDLSLDFGMAAGPYCSGQKIEMKVLPELKDKFTNFHWDFEDGYPENGVDSVMQKYLYAGTYHVKLSAHSVSEGSCPVTTSPKLVEVHETPFASIVPVGNLMDCAPYTVETFSRVGTGNELAFWDFKNGDTSTDPIVHNVTFKEAGEYPVLLRLTSPEGCVDTASRLVIVKKSPQPVFEISDSLFCTSEGNVQISLENKTAEAELSSFEWSYNNQPAFSRNEQPEALNLTNMFGEIRLKLLATNRETGCANVFERKAVSGQTLKLAVDVDTMLCYDEPIALVNSATDVKDIVWNLGDGTLETENAISYVYDHPGQYHLEVSGKNESGCTDTLRKVITVYPLPFADFSYAEDNMSLADLKLPDNVDISKIANVKNGVIRFTNHSTIDKYDFSTGKLNSLWNFGDGSDLLSTDETTHHFSNNGLYEVKLVVRGDHGCADSVSQLISIDAVKGLFIPNAFAPAAGKEANPGISLFQPKGIGLLVYKIRVFDHWGTCVWSSDKLLDGRPAEAWDGTFNGDPLPKGRYTWEANAVFIDGSVWPGENGYTRGNVMLIR